MINNNLAIKDLDLYPAAGFGWALNKKHSVAIEGKEGINIKFDNQKGAPLLIGIEITKKL